MAEEKILSRIRKMLALANDEAASEGERDNAMRMAHNLMSKYQLDMHDVSKHMRDAEDPRGRFDEFGYCATWARYVRKAVADLFMCKYYYTTVNAMKDNSTFIGRESNATTALLISDFIVRSVLKESKLRYKGDAKAQRSFCVGSQYRIQERIALLQKAKQAEVAAAGYGLVLVEEAKAEAMDNDAFIQAAGTAIVTAKARQQAALNYGAMAAGSEYAKGLGLHAQVSGNTKSTKAITNG